jgi:hypothetical protein
MPRPAAAALIWLQPHNQTFTLASADKVNFKINNR